MKLRFWRRPHFSGIKGLPELVRCPQCTLKSANANDIAQGWCGKCEAYTSKPQSNEVRKRVAKLFTPMRQRGPADSSEAYPWKQAQWHPQALIDPE
jgi:hypothetical protein